MYPELGGPACGKQTTNPLMEPSAKLEGSIRGQCLLMVSVHGINSTVCRVQWTGNGVQSYTVQSPFPRRPQMRR
jgi:hypothetical protein